MQSISFKSLALAAHRWLGLVLTPIFLLVIISGGFLAFKPIVEDPRFSPATPVIETSALITALKAADPKGQANQITVSADGQAVVLASQSAGGPAGSFAIPTGERVAGVEASLDLFGMAKSLHKNLLLGAGTLVLVATYAMLAIILVGPALGWLRFRNSIAGWHLAAGWIAFPLVVLSPLTGVLMSLHLGGANMPSIQQSRPPLSLARGIEVVAQNPAVTSITFARRFRQGSVMVDARTGDGDAKYIVDGTQTAMPLEGGPGLVKSLHEGTWAGAWSGSLNVIVSIILAGLTVTGLWSWLRRRHQARKRLGAEDADILVTHASQTGTAALLAEATFHAFERSGAKVAYASLSGISLKELQRYRQILMIASTTGEGELAEPGRAFVQELLQSGKIQTSFAILALGDRRYQHFCAGGEKLRSALLTAGARELAPMICADGPPESAWREWLAELQRRLEITLVEVEAPLADAPVTLELLERTRLDNPELGEASEAWQVVFAIKDDVRFRPGDLLMLSPSENEPERCYSIGSSALINPDRVALTVARHRWEDADGACRMGRMSTLLCRDIPVGARISGSIRCHADFHPPEDPAAPVIMVATGCGVAPFMGFIEERTAMEGPTGPTWLMFGNRYRQGDFLYSAKLAGWRKQGILTQLLTTFSRDNDDGRYITEEISIHGRAIVDLIRDKGAVLYICGRARLGRGVEQALVDALVANDNLSKSEAERTVQKWKASGSLRQDLFD